MRIDEALNIFNLPALPANKKYTIKEVMERADHLLSANKGSLDTNIKIESTESVSAENITENVTAEPNTEKTVATELKEEEEIKTDEAKIQEKIYFSF